MGEGSEDLDLQEFPEVLKEFDEVKEIMEEEEVSAEKALKVLKDRKKGSAISDFSSEGLKAFIGLLEKRPD